MRSICPLRFGREELRREGCNAGFPHWCPNTCAGTSPLRPQKGDSREPAIENGVPSERSDFETATRPKMTTTSQQWTQSLGEPAPRDRKRIHRSSENLARRTSRSNVAVVGYQRAKEKQECNRLRWNPVNESRLVQGKDAALSASDLRAYGQALTRRAAFT